MCVGVLADILCNIHVGVLADTLVSTGCCSILDNIVSFLFKRVTKKKSSQEVNGMANGDSLVQILETRPQILQQVAIYLLMECVMQLT